MNELNDQNFEEEVIKSEKPVLVDFWSIACPPCIMLESIIAEIAKDFGGKVKIGKLNVMENPETAGKYKIVGTPTIIIFKNGEPIERATGLRSKEAIADKLNSIIS